MSTSRVLNTPTPTGTDSEAIHAIRGGDLDRYRDLIRRYERQVFAVAWSRLGDAALAEEVVQESFIRAYRYLGWLRDPARFGSWLFRIARRIAINLGLRHRRELSRRQRWALETTPASTDSPDSDPGPVASETLRHSLAALPARHRECLVLHYLEGLPMADAARSLAISEGAFRVRLHRARAALRLRLDAELRKSLEHLHTRHSLAPAIMALLPATTQAGWGAGLIGGLGATLSKWLPASFVVALTPFLAVPVGLAAASWVAREERKNFKDPGGFRAQLHRRAVVRGLITTSVIVAIVAAAFWVTNIPGTPITGMHLLCALGIGLWAASLRILHIIRNPAMVIQVLGGLPLWVVLLAHLWHPMPFWAFGAAQALLFISFAYGAQALPRRFDYNLFLRRSKGMLPPVSSAPPPPGRLLHHDILRFGRLLGREWIVCAFRRETDGYTFGLTPVEQHPWRLTLPILWPGSSLLQVRTNGQIEATLGRADARALDQMGVDVERSRLAWQTDIAVATTESLRFFLSGDPRNALLRLGQTPSDEIFRVPPTRSRALRVQRAMMIAAAGAMALFVFIQISTGRGVHRTQPPAHLQPVALTASEAREHLRALSLGNDPASRRAWRTIAGDLHSAVALPPPDWFQHEGLLRIRRNLLEREFAGATNVDAAVDLALGYPALLRAVEFGWVTVDDLHAFGISSDSIRETAPAWPPHYRNRRLLPEELTVSGRTQSALDTESFYWRCTLLARFGCLDLIDSATVIDRLAAHQIQPPPSRPPADDGIPDIDRRIWTGLFATSGFNPIRETYYALAILEMLGGLERVDRQACVAGILKCHRGRGYFHIEPARHCFLWGDARETFMARESLRILGALDQVRDLALWEYRPRWTEPRQQVATEAWRPGWHEIEAAWMKEAHPQNVQPPPTASPSHGTKG